MNDDPKFRMFLAGMLASFFTTVGADLAREGYFPHWLGLLGSMVFGVAAYRFAARSARPKVQEP